MRRLVEALNACWLPHVPGRPPLTLADFKRDIRERHVWCSSCMIAFDGPDPIGVLIGAKRPHATLIDVIAVRPDRMRRGHGRHILESLSAKLEILGPKRLVAEIPESRPEAIAFFEACGFRREATLTDWVLEDGGRPGVAAREADPAAPALDASGRFLVPATVADLAANRLLETASGVAWDREAATLQARADRLPGFSLATVDRIEAFVLYRRPADGSPGASIDALGPASGVGREEARLLLAAVREAAGGPLEMARVAEGEIDPEWLAGWGFRPAATTCRLAAIARAK